MYQYKPIIKDKIYVGLLLLFIIAMVLIIVVPDNLKNKNSDAQIIELKKAQEVQQKLRPLYDKIISRMNVKKLSGLPVEKQESLDRSEIGNISEVFKDLAEKNGLECLQSTPDVDSLSGESNTMLINVVLKGKFRKFRKFLLDMANLDYLNSIEETKLVSEQIGKKYFLKIWISIK